ncbi:MAG TPA: prepilin-type N-terminal cleavage/methylation domain-containing protein [Gemmatimonadaceae bacterium]|nr:prepilin-type N-terminal cleavage/methylation domain-containing protein [Gemmatimonadaceae bacterium]
MKNHSKSPNPVANRGGFTLLEMLISMTLMALVLGLTVPFFRTEVQAFGNIGGRDDAQQNARYGVSMVDRELRVAGVGVLDAQPLIVQAAPYAVTFNVDLVSRDPADRGAAYYDPDINVAAASSLPKTSKVTLPLSSVQYPDSNYFMSAGAPSEAETVSFWVALDPDPSAGGTYALYRRVNALPPTVVAKALVLPTGEPAFRYFKADTLGQLVEIPQAMLPLYHSAAIHNSKADTAKSALTDSIRVVRVRLTGQYKDRKGVLNKRPVETGVRIMNAGLLHFHTCGDPPIFSSAVVAVASAAPVTKVVLSWNPSVDQSSGEKDVEQYSIYKRASSATVFNEPIASIPGGSPNYSFTDTQVQSGDRLIYGVAAVDCGGQSSAVATAPLVIVP